MADVLVQPLRIFISSPGDLGAERQRATELIGTLGRMRHIAPRYQLVPVAFETFAPPLAGSAPQDVVDRYAMRASDADIYLCILWRRFGTPFTEAATGKTFGSGTEYEFLDAYRAFEAQGKPRILLYRCDRPAEPGSPAGDRDRVEAFFRQFEGPQAALRGLYRTFRSTDEFEQGLLQDLDTVIDSLGEQAKPVRVRASYGNDGCMLIFEIPEPPIDISYRLEPDESFRSTGTHPWNMDPRTGKPYAQIQATVPDFDEPRRIAVRYRDRFGQERGPFEMTLDPVTLRVADVRANLQSIVRWVEFRHYDGKLLAYFTALLGWKHAIRSIEYSVDDESLARRVAFRPWRLRDGPGTIEDGDEVYVEVPLATKFVAARVTFRDGTPSETRRFEAPPPE